MYSMALLVARHAPDMYMHECLNKSLLLYSFIFMLHPGRDLFFLILMVIDFICSHILSLDEGRQP